MLQTISEAAGYAPSPAGSPPPAAEPHHEIEAAVKLQAAGRHEGPSRFQREQMDSTL